jgi:hypothetical protein
LRVEIAVQKKIKYMPFKFNLKYFLLALLLFVTEVLIALYVHDQIIRPYFGDVLVILLMYYAIKAILDYPVLPTAIGVLIISFVIEALQYLNIVEQLGLQDNKIAATVIGTSFSWVDIYAYIIGFFLVLILEKQPPFKIKT